MYGKDDHDFDKKLFGVFKSYLFVDPKHTKAVDASINKVMKSLVSNNRVIKAAAQVGEVRQWSDGPHKKLGPGNWVKVNDKGEEVSQDNPSPKEPEKKPFELTDKQEEYLKEKLDKLKFFDKNTLNKNPNTKAIIDALKEDHPNLDLDSLSKIGLVGLMKDKIKEVLEKKKQNMASQGEASKLVEHIEDNPKPSESIETTADKVGNTGLLSKGDFLALKFEDLKEVKPLGGSTGAKLYKDDKGNQYVVKKGAGGKTTHAINEAETNNLYAKVGVLAAESIVAGDGTPYGQVCVSRYVDGVTLKEHLSNASDDKINAIKTELQKGFIYDALFANWDVIGMGMDNIIVDKAGKPHRIDNGGSINFRAQGGTKSFEAGFPKEITTMRQHNVNPSSAKIFASMTDDDIKKSINSEKKNLDTLKNSLPFTHTGNTLMSRIEALQDWAKADAEIKTPAPSEEAKKVASSISDHIGKLNNWSKANILSSKKTKDFVDFVQKSTGKDFSSMDKDEVVSTIKSMYNSVAPSSTPFYDKGSVAQRPGGTPPLPELKPYYDKVKIQKDHSDKKVTNIQDATNATKAYVEDLSYEVRDAVVSYTASGYASMNKILRNENLGTDNPGTIEFWNDQIAKVDKFITHAPKYKGKVYRGINANQAGPLIGEMIQAAQSGNGVVELKGFSSFSASAKNTFHNSATGGSVIMEVKSKSGAFVSIQNLGVVSEKEVLYNTHTKFIVKKYVKVDGAKKSPAGTNHRHYFLLEEV